MTGELPKGTYPEIEDKLRSEGFHAVYVWHDDPGEFYLSHTHDEDVSLVVTKGEMIFVMDGITKVLKPGDRIDIPKKTEHSSKAGNEGCDFVEGEK